MSHRALLLSMLVLTGCPNPSPEGSDCPEPTGPGVTHSETITADETWSAADGPHLVPSGLDVRATLTIEACAVVRVGEGMSITVGDSATTGRIVAHGTATETVRRPVRFESATSGTHFGGLVVLNGSLDLEHVEIDHAGAGGAAIELSGPDDDTIEPSLRAVSTRITSSSRSGIRLTRGAAFTDDSRDLVITGAGAGGGAEPSYPIDIDPPGIGSIPDGAYTGNARDEIVVRTAWPRVIVDETFRSVGVPYFIDETFLMYDPDGADLTLTIEPGTTLRFDASSAGGVGMVLGNAASGSEVRLVAEGTREQPITFTSAAPAPAPGAWAGILMAHGSASGNVLAHAIVEYAGGATSVRGYGCGTMENVGGLLIIDWLPADAFVTGSTFRHTVGAGIVSGWTLGAGVTPVDLRSDNVFEDIHDYMSEGHCDVAEWHPDAPDCRIPRIDGVTCVGG